MILLGHKLAIFYAILAAALYAVSIPFSKLILNNQEIPAPLMAALMYLGAGLGLGLVGLVQKLLKITTTEKSLTRKELPYTIGMIVLDIAAPIALMVGLNKSKAANASLLNNFEIVATSIIALVIFKEVISKRLWLAIGLVTISSIILTFENEESFSFSIGSLFVLLACVCWGFENNCTRMMSSKNPLEIVVLKGFGSGFGSLIIAFICNEFRLRADYVVYLLLLGFFSYGLSIFFYVYAQRILGAAKTSTYYAVSPFIGAILSLILFQEVPSISFAIALVIMIIGTYLASENPEADPSTEEVKELKELEENANEDNNEGKEEEEKIEKEEDKKDNLPSSSSSSNTTTSSNDKLNKDENNNNEIDLAK